MTRSRGNAERSSIVEAAMTLRVLVAGVSSSEVCGVRDYARSLSNELARDGITPLDVWGDLSPRPTRREANGWLQRVEARARCGSPNVLLLHYSVFTLSWRGVPVHVGRVARRLRSLGIPVVILLHEMAYPWGRRGWRGAVCAITQRVALVAVIHCATGLVVTTVPRREWLRERRWLPKRPITVAPVFSNIPFAGDSVACSDDLVGEYGLNDIALFGFGAESAMMDVVTEAIAQISSLMGRLVLVGAPGADSAMGVRWSRRAAASGCPIRFTGVVSPESLSREMRAAALVVFADGAGPTSRRTTLAAALAQGKAVVALDGPETWDELRVSQAVSLVAPDPTVLAAEISRLLGDEHASLALGQRARDFYDHRMAVQHAANVVADALKSAAARQCSTTVTARLHRLRVELSTPVLVGVIAKTAWRRRLPPRSPQPFRRRPWR